MTAGTATKNLRLTRGQAIGWASGTVGSSSMLGAISLIVLFFATEYLGIAPALAGLLIFTSRIFDLIVSPLIGQWSDRTESSIGRRRPFLLAGAPVCALAFFALFAAPELLSGWALVAWVQAALLLWALGYSLFVVPYLAMPAEITGDPKQRTAMMSWRVVAQTLAGLVIAVLAPAMIANFGGGRSGYAAMGAIVGALILVAMWGSVAATWRVRDYGGRLDAIALRDQLRAIGNNRPYLVYLAVKLCQLLAAATVGSGLLYVARYILGQDESFLVRFGVLQLVGTLLTVPVWGWLCGRLGKRNTYMGAGFLYALISISWLFASASEPALITNIRLFAVGVGATGLLVAGLSILPDTMEYGRRQSGASLEGTLSAFYAMVEKGAAALGPLLAGLLLEVMGFVTPTPGAETFPEQSDTALLAIYILVGALPAAANILGSLILLAYPARLERELG